MMQHDAEWNDLDLSGIETTPSSQNKNKKKSSHNNKYKKMKETTIVKAINTKWVVASHNQSARPGREPGVGELGEHYLDATPSLL